MRESAHFEFTLQARTWVLKQKTRDLAGPLPRQPSVECNHSGKVEFLRHFSFDYWGRSRCPGFKSASRAAGFTFPSATKMEALLASSDTPTASSNCRRQRIGTNVVKLKRAKKRPRSSRGFFILRFGLGLESTLEFHQLRRRWRLAEHLSRAFLRLTSNQPRCCQLRRSLLPRCSEPRPSHQLEHQFVQMKRY
jgi:hypothetical protein